MSCTSYTFPKNSAEVRKHWTLGQRRQAVRELAMQQFRSNHPDKFFRSMSLVENSDLFLVSIYWSTEDYKEPVYKDLR
jgi:hypothetical protein